jgi:hypothetical protein
MEQVGDEGGKGVVKLGLTPVFIIKGSWALGVIGLGGVGGSGGFGLVRVLCLDLDYFGFKVIIGRFGCNNYSRTNFAIY